MLGMIRDEEWWILVLVGGDLMKIWVGFGCGIFFQAFWLWRIRGLEKKEVVFNKGLIKKIGLKHLPGPSRRTEHSVGFPSSARCSIMWELLSELTERSVHFASSVRCAVLVRMLSELTEHSVHIASSARCNTLLGSPL